MSSGGLICGDFNDPLSRRFLLPQKISFPSVPVTPIAVNIWGIWWDDRVMWFDPRASWTRTELGQLRAEALQRGGLNRAYQCKVDEEQLQLLLQAMIWLQHHLQDQKIRGQFIWNNFLGGKQPYAWPELISYLEQPPYWLHQQQLNYAKSLLQLTCEAEAKPILASASSWELVELGEVKSQMLQDWDQQLLVKLHQNLELLHQTTITHIKNSDWQLLQQLCDTQGLSLAELGWCTDLAASFGQTIAVPVLLPASAIQFKYQNLETSESSNAVLYSRPGIYPTLYDNLLYFFLTGHKLELVKLLQQWYEPQGGYLAFPQDRYQMSIDHLWIAATGQLTILPKLIDKDAALFYIGHHWIDAAYIPLGVLNKGQAGNSLRANYHSNAEHPYLVCAWTNLWAILLLTNAQWLKLCNIENPVIRCWQSIRHTCGVVYAEKLSGISYYSNHLVGCYANGNWINEQPEKISSVISWTNTLLAIDALQHLILTFTWHLDQEQWRQDLANLEQVVSKFNAGVPPTGFQTEINNQESETLADGRKVKIQNTPDWFATQLHLRLRYQLPLFRDYGQQLTWLW